MPGLVHSDRPVGEIVLVLAHRCAAENGPDPGDHLHHAEGLAQIIVGAQIEADNSVILASLGGSHDDRKSDRHRCGPKLFEDRDAVLAWQHDVQQYQFGAAGLHFFPERFTVGKAFRLKSGYGQGIDHQISDAVVIFHAIYHCVLL